MKKIRVVGIGPGHPDYLLPRAAEIIRTSEVIVGGKRHLETLSAVFDFSKKMTWTIDADLEKTAAFIRTHHLIKSVCVVVSGDTGFYSLLRYLKKQFDVEMLEVIPGISSLQYFFSRLGMTWENALLTSLHGREHDLESALHTYDAIGILTDRKWTPARIAAWLIEYGFEDRRVYVGENLSYDDEKITSGLPDDFLNWQATALCVVVIENVYSIQ